MKQEEFESIASTLRHRILAVARGFHLDDEAEDVAQETMLKLWNMRERLDGSQPVEPLVICMARRLSIDHLRRRHTVALDEATSIVGGAQPDTALESNELEEWLAAQMEQLPTTEHTILHLRQVERKSSEEIAAIVGISPASVAPLLSRARRKLLAKFQEHQTPF